MAEVQKGVIAEKNLTVTGVHGVPVRIRAGRKVPTNLLEAYNKEVGGSKRAKTTAKRDEETPRAVTESEPAEPDRRKRGRPRKVDAD